MDALYVVGGILSLIGIVGFFHIWSLVIKIRKEARDHTGMMIIALSLIPGRGSIVGKEGVAESWMGPADAVKGSVVVEGRAWDCRPTGHIEKGAKVRVLGFEGPVLVVEKAG
jgi:membrane-bound ClpP family serine protease